MEVVRYSTAKAAGLTHYFTGKPCKRGHVAIRYVSATACSECLREQKEGRRTKPRRAAKTPEGRAQHRRDFYLANSERLKAEAADWRSKNKLSVRAHASARRARVRGAAGVYTKRDVEEIYAMQRGKCAYCPTLLGGGYDVDHIVAISRGGRNDRRNIQLLCRPCNRWKSDSDPVDFSRKTGRLI